MMLSYSCVRVEGAAGHLAGRPILKHVVHVQARHAGRQRALQPQQAARRAHQHLARAGRVSWTSRACRRRTTGGGAFISRTTATSADLNRGNVCAVRRKCSGGGSFSTFSGGGGCQRLWLGLAVLLKLLNTVLQPKLGNNLYLVGVSGRKRWVVGVVGGGGGGSSAVAGRATVVVVLATLLMVVDAGCGLAVILSAVVHVELPVVRLREIYGLKKYI